MPASALNKKMNAILMPANALNKKLNTIFMPSNALTHKKEKRDLYIT